jgi:hypothetical protein
MTKLSKIIGKLKETQQQQTKIDAQIFGLAAAATQLNEDLLTNLEEQPHLLTPSSRIPITKEYCLEKFGSYKATYNAYKKSHKISCPTGWKYLLPIIEEIEMLQSSRELPQSIVQKARELIATRNITEETLLDFAYFVLAVSGRY